MSNETPNNGKPLLASGTHVNYSLGPKDKYILIMVDDVSGNLTTIAPNVANSLDVAQIMMASLNAVMQRVSEEQKEKASPIVQLPAGARLRKP